MLSQNAKVLRNGGLRDPEFGLDHRAQLAGGSLSVGQELEDPAPDRITEDVEGMHSANISS